MDMWELVIPLSKVEPHKVEQRQQHPILALENVMQAAIQQVH